MLLDCGLVPDKYAIFNMFLAMETDPYIGGVCGFMGIKFADVYTEGGERSKEKFKINFFIPFPFKMITIRKMI